MQSAIEMTRNIVRGRTPTPVLAFAGGLLLASCGGGDGSSAKSSEAAYAKAMKAEQYEVAWCIKTAMAFDANTPKYCSCEVGLKKKAAGKDYQAWEEIFRRTLVDNAGAINSQFAEEGWGDVAYRVMHEIAGERGIDAEEYVDRYEPKALEADVEKKCGKYDG